MSIHIRLTQLTPDRGTDAPVLLVGPSLGTSVTMLWRECATQLADTVSVVGWDLPGHGASPAAAQSFDISQLASAVAAAFTSAFAARKCWYAGDSVGGAVGLHLALEHPELVCGVAAVCSAAQFGEPSSWTSRAELVRRAGTSAVIEASAGRWFTGDFIAQHPELVSPMLQELGQVDDESYARICAALARFDVRARLSDLQVPILAIAGAEDRATPPQKSSEIVRSAPDARIRVLPDVAHLAPVEAPAAVAALLGEFVSGAMASDDLHAKGMAVRREVLGAEHVDRATDNTTAFTEDFQHLITRYAWGEIWNRPGLDRRSRSMITMTALIACGHWDEFAMHVRAAVRNGLSVNEIQEVILQSAIYCGVPAANHAFAEAARALEIRKGPGNADPTDS